MAKAYLLPQLVTQYSSYFSNTNENSDLGLAKSGNENLEWPTILPSSKITSFLLCDVVTKSEVLWCTYCVSTHTSYRAGESAIELFPQMFPDGFVAPKLKLHKDKIAYSMTYDLGPYFSKVVEAKAKQRYFFALSIDESLNDVS